MSLPSEPITRKESYLAKAAGQAVEIPAEPITREEAYLDAIAKGSGGGGGGTKDYSQLDNKPQINGNTLTGNKTASQLGLVAAVEGKGLSTNDYTDADKAIVGGVTAALAGKQDELTAGSHIAIDDDTISVNRWAVPAGKVVYTVITSDENYGQNVHIQRHTLGGAFIDDRTFLCEMYKTVNIDGLISIQNPYASFNITLLKDSDEQQAGYRYTVNPITTPTSNSFTFTMAQEENDNDLIIRSELDAKQDTLTFDNVPTANSDNPVKSGGVKSAIDAAVSSAYHHAGTKTCVELVAGLLVAGNEGNVYNMTDSGTTTSDFIEGEGQPIKAGDNVGVCKVSDGVYKFDLLSGFVDTSNFVQKSVTAGLIKNDGTIDTVEKQPKTDNNLTTTSKDTTGAINELRSGFTALDNEVNGSATTYPYADVITINDAVPANLADCSVKVEPVQDLHGYDKPWVGGAGKNKLPMTVDGIKAANTDGTWSGNTYTYNDIVYTLVTDNDGNLVKITVNGTTTLRSFLIVGSMSGLIGQEVIMNGGASGGVASYTASGYCLFTGGIGVPQEYDIGSGATFTVSSNGGNVNINVNNTSVSNLDFYPMIRLSTETDATFEPYTNICPISGHTEASVEVTDGDETTKTYTIALGDTIYGGTVDFDSGVMTVDRKGVDMGALTWTYHAAGGEYTEFFDTNLPNDSIVGDMQITANIISPLYRTIPSHYIAQDGYDNGVQALAHETRRLITCDKRYSNAADYTNAVDGNILVYELATPTTIQLTPQQIQLLKGTNTLTASTGQISVTVNGVSGAIGSVQEQVNDHEERIETVESGLTGVVDATNLLGLQIRTVDSRDKQVSEENIKSDLLASTADIMHRPCFFDIRYNSAEVMAIGSRVNVGFGSWIVFDITDTKFYSLNSNAWTISTISRT